MRGNLVRDKAKLGNAPLQPRLDFEIDTVGLRLRSDAQRGPGKPVDPRIGLPYACSKDCGAWAVVLVPETPLVSLPYCAKHGPKGMR